MGGLSCTPLPRWPSTPARALRQLLQCLRAHCGASLHSSAAAGQCRKIRWGEGDDVSR